MSTEPIKVLLDTDIGTDIDDAICLAYLLCQPRCELIGVATVSGKPTVRASLVDAICKVAGRGDIPIHAGSEHGIAAPTRACSSPPTPSRRRSWRAS